MIARWTDASHQFVSSSPSSVDEVRALIAEVRALPEPTMLFLERDGKLLAVGLGGALSPVTWMEPGGATFHTVGDLSRIGCIQLWSQTQLDDFFAELAIPEAAAIAAAIFFASTGERPPDLHWEADW
ncbi:MAG TPA: Imm1 family immunity protein [Polyangia bacterium]|nr:Imm1 family immunity protein [Polyangia bacterium]